MTGSYLAGFVSLVHSVRHSITAVLSGATKYGIEYRALVNRSIPVNRLSSGGSVTRCNVDLR